MVLSVRETKMFDIYNLHFFTEMDKDLKASILMSLNSAWKDLSDPVSRSSSLKKSSRKGKFCGAGGCTISKGCVDENLKLVKL